MPGVDGLLHVSEIANYRVKDVRDELKEGEQVMVKVINIDPSGKVRLSRKALLGARRGHGPARPAPRARRPARTGDGHRDHGGRGARRQATAAGVRRGGTKARPVASAWGSTLTASSAQGLATLAPSRSASA